MLPGKLSAEGYAWAEGDLSHSWPEETKYLYYLPTLFQNIPTPSYEVLWPSCWCLSRTFWGSHPFPSMEFHGIPGRAVPFHEIPWPSIPLFLLPYHSLCLPFLSPGYLSLSLRFYLHPPHILGSQEPCATTTLPTVILGSLDLSKLHWGQGLVYWASKLWVNHKEMEKEPTDYLSSIH